jgi:hypothetical protein
MITRIADRGAARRASAPQSPVRGLLRLLSAAAWTLLGALAYVVCQGMFGGYPQVHSELLTTLGMIAIALTGCVAWIIDERRSHGDE